MTPPTSSVAVQSTVAGLHLPRRFARFSARLLSPADAAAVFDLRRRVFATLPLEFRLNDPADQDVERAEREWADEHLNRPAITLGVFAGASLIAYATVILPGGDYRCEIGDRLNLSSDDMANSAHLASCFIDNGYRGHGLQLKLIKWRLAVARIFERRLVVSMTAAGNEYSRRNLLAAGLSVKRVAERTPGRFWYYLGLDLAAPQRRVIESVWVHDSERARQVELTAAGFEGIVEKARLGPHSHEFFIQFALLREIRDPR